MPLTIACSTPSRRLRTAVKIMAVVALLVRVNDAWGASLDAKERAARTACLAGDYQKGVASLAELFVQTKDPTYIFNQGRCFEQNGRYQQAIDRFREYLRIGSRLNNDEIALTQRHIADCESLARGEESRADHAAPKPHTGEALPPATQPNSVSPRPELQVRQEKAAPLSSQTPGRGLRIGGITTAAVGVVLIGAGVGLNLKVNQMADELQSPGAYSRSTESRRSTYATMAWTAYGVGGLFAVTGATLFYFGWRIPSGGIVVQPAFGMAGATLAGEF